MNKKIIENIIITIIVSIVFLSVTLNLYQVETYKLEQRKLEEEQEKLEEEIRRQQELREKRLQELKEEKEREIVEIIDFHQEYISLSETFLSNISNIEDNSNNKAGNIGKLKDSVRERIEASKEFKDSFSNIDNIPDPLKTFYDYNIEFLTMDLKYWLLVQAYYNSGEYSTNNSEDIEQFRYKAISLSNKAREELKRVYKKYRLKYLIEDIK